LWHTHTHKDRNEFEVQTKLGKIGDGPAPTRMVSFPIGRAIAADIYIWSSWGLLRATARHWTLLWKSKRQASSWGKIVGQEKVRSFTLFLSKLWIDLAISSPTTLFANLVASKTSLVALCISVEPWH
jgi:hypothetical protein